MKKVLSLVLAVVLVCGMATVGFAAAPKITGIKESFYYTIGESGAQVKGSHHLDTIGPDVTLKLYFDVNQFTWEPADYPATKGAKLTSSNLSTYKLTIKKKVSKGSNVLDEVKLDKDGNYQMIKIDFTEEWISTSDQDFDFKVYLAKSSSKQDDTEVQITGTMKNDEILLDEDDEEVDLSDGQYAKAEDYIKSIRVDTGNGLYINTKMFDGKKYYAKSNQDITTADDAILNEYPEIDTIYTLNTINMSSAGNTVEFDIDDKYYVYNSDGQYVGTTSDILPFSSKYYMATAKINMGSNTSSSNTPVEVPGNDLPANSTTSNPTTGGDSR